MTKSYTITLSETQANVVIKALDAYSRIGMGQVGTAITDHPDVVERFMSNHQEMPLFDVSDYFDTLIKSIIFKELPAGGYHGIFSEEIAESNRIAYDIQQVLRNRVAWANYKEGQSTIQVKYDRPMQTSVEDLPVCEVGE